MRRHGFPSLLSNYPIQPPATDRRHVGPLARSLSSHEPIFEELKETYDGRGDVLKVNADESQSLIKQLGVLGIPTTILYRNGEEIGRRTGP
ncbi:MAG TPA: thioredoxin [Anaerolineae bacterium]|nr:thioredoxin [Anaerolineae bacterium]HIQ12271.1 thioredoxin [Caldilineales bacterium]